MALSNLTTPGVYIEEISTLPPSVAPVSTAVPGFIGYTEKGPINTPTRITSMIEFEATFGGAFDEQYTATIDVSGTFTGVVATSGVPANTESPYTLFYHLQMYFGNGGGPCHIIAVDHYNSTVTLDPLKFYNPATPQLGVGSAEEVDEITLLVAPEVEGLTGAADIRSIYDAMLAQCDKLKDRFVIMDVKSTGDPSADGLAFRNTNVSANFLKYGAAYYPLLDTILKHNYSDDEVLIDDNRLVPVYVEPNDRLSTVLGGIGAYMLSTVSTLQTYGSAPAAGDSVVVTFNGTPYTFVAGVDFPAVPPVSGPIPTDADIAAGLITAINNHTTLSLLARAVVDSTNDDAFYVVARVGSTSTTITIVESPSGWLNTGSLVVPLANNTQNTGLYLDISNAIDARVLRLPPSATMAGIYSAVDNDRGVWKAPANVSIANIIGPSFQITEAQQGGLNVDPTGGKSINAIRSFIGRGTLVWGSRTLDGNSNEWRYVPVRRLFIFVEESTKKACEFVVFEPNDKNTWLRVKGTITNFLTDIWRQGALAGSKPEDAFFVQVGLGETMTAQDILEGKLIVRIGMAAVRPAEFIVLQFMHKLQEA